MMAEHQPEQAKESLTDPKEPKDTKELKDLKEPVLVSEPEQTESLSVENQEGEPLLDQKHEVQKHAIDKHETEWIPGEQLELTRLPPPTIWPATLALGITGIAFGVVTHWILSAAGLFLFLLGAAGWIEDLKKDVL